VVIDSSTKFNLLGPRPMYGGIVEDKHGFTILCRESVKPGCDFEGNHEKQPSPTKPMRPEEVIDNVLPKLTVGVTSRGSVNIRS